SSDPVPPALLFGRWNQTLLAPFNEIPHPCRTALPIGFSVSIDRIAIRQRCRVHRTPFAGVLRLFCGMKGGGIGLERIYVESRFRKVVTEVREGLLKINGLHERGGSRGGLGQCCLQQIGLIPQLVIRQWGELHLHPPYRLWTDVVKQDVVDPSLDSKELIAAGQLGCNG